MSFTTGASVSSRPFSLDQLQAGLAGNLITPDSVEFEDARKVANVTVDRRPLAIVQAATADDVAAAVNFANEQNLPLAVRSGGHSVGRHSMIDDGIVVDFSAMKQVVIDPDTRIARVQAGANSGDLAAVAGPH